MSAVTRPRGPLPGRVYWARRLFVVLVSFGLVFGIARALGGVGGGNGPSARPVGADASAATSAAATSSSTAPATTTTGTPSVDATGTGSSAAATTTPTGTKTPAATPMAQPTGQCANSDIVASPSVNGRAYAGKPVILTTTLTTKESPACTWTTSAASLALKLTSGSDRVWSTQQCTDAVPRQTVVVRKDHPLTISIVWNGQRSDTDCTRTTTWAEPGFYHAVAAALGADPTDRQFELLPPPRPTVTKTPTPDASASATPRQRPTDRPTSGNNR